MQKWWNSSIEQSGWRGRGLLVLMGALGALAMPPIYGWPFAILSLSYLFARLGRQSAARQGFAAGWWWGLGYFIAGLYWICIALTLDIVAFGWMIPFALLGMNAFLALFTALACALYIKMRGRFTTLNLLWFALSMFAAEYARGHVLTGFPWNLMGYSWGASDIMAQSASLLGIYGLTFLTFLIAPSPVLWAQGKRIAPLACLCMLVGLAAYGLQRLNQPVPLSDVTVRLVQANVPQKLKWEPDFIDEALARHISLSQAEGQEAVDVIIWPETALPHILYPLSSWPAQLGLMLKPDQWLVTGAVLSNGNEKALQMWNGLAVINAQGEMVATHAKHHLVPFGEYVPLRGILPVEKITPGLIDFSKGEDANRAIELSETIRFLPLICYEVIFPTYASLRGERDAFLLNLTNDGWYGVSSGPFQHREMARFRAIEQGMPMVRAASTGISVVYDPFGREIGHIPLNQKGFIDVQLPLALPTRTIYDSIVKTN